MSWYSDRESFDEYDPDYCKSCDGDTSYEACRRCAEAHEQAETEGESDDD